jgi:ATP-dependent helicase YprA (DUF1998 family)
MDAIHVTESLRDSFIRYLLTTFDVGRSNPALATAIRRSFEAPGVLFRGPFLELNPPYGKGLTLRDLSVAGVVNENMCRLRDDISPSRDRPLPPDRELYVHQESAIRRIISHHRNVVIASGTGSGKTECFLIPILHDLLSNPAPGVRALIIYPMNALVNDQLLRLRRLLRGTSITFGRYTSELEIDEARGRAKSPDAPMNEVVSREVIRGYRGRSPSPPQILITNYAMLEYLLLRPEDSPIFESGLWRFVCLDEAHTYAGAQGIEVSMLLRRLKHRLNKRRGELRCIATSATLTRDDVNAAASFAARLFGEEFSAEDVIFGETLLINDTNTAEDSSPAVEAYIETAEALKEQQLVERLRESSSRENIRSVDLVREVAQVFEAAGLVSSDRIRGALGETADGDVARFIWAVLKTNRHLIELRALMQDRPIELEDVARHIFGEDHDSRNTAAVCSLVELGALARESIDTAPLLPARFHLFARGPQGAWLCINPRCPEPVGPNEGWSRLFLEKRERCNDCGAAVFELAVCRNCGQPYLRGFQREHLWMSEGRYEDDFNGQRYFTWRSLTVQPDPDSDNAESEESDTSALQICLICRHESADCPCLQQSQVVTLYTITDARGNPRETMSTCARCKARTPGEIVTSVRVARSAPLAVLTEELYRKTPPSSDPIVRSKAGEGRKLLTFADSRQGAARYAAYLQATVNDSLYRHLIARAAQELNGLGRIPDIEELAERCVALAGEYGIYGDDNHHATPAERRRRMADARARITAEFCARTDPRHSLWALGLVGCDVHFASSETVETLSSQFDILPTEMMTVVQALLDSMRLDKAVTMPLDVTANNEAFGRNTATIRYRLTEANASNFERNWVGSSNQQGRFDYVQRLLQATGRSAEVLNVRNGLQAVWDWLHGQSVFVSTGNTSYQINVARLIFITDRAWYRCDGCLKLSRRLISENLRICPSRGCTGTLRVCDPTVTASDDHYRVIFSRNPIGMRVEEHTAQLQPDLGRKYQDQFIDGDINVLSCSTTFELGVDVGELQTVVLNNVPPTVANYRQRAGRAGRRAGGAAFILTYAAARPHDRLYFGNPAEIIAGEVSVPSLSTTNRVISSRHLNAILLGDFLRYLARLGRSELLSSGAFFAPNSPNGRHIDFMSGWNTNFHQELVRRINQFNVDNPDATDDNPEVCLGRLSDALHDRCEKFERWIAEYERLRDHYTQIANTSHDRTEQQSSEKMRRRFNGLRQRLLDEPLIDFLCREGIIPSYSFPIDVVNLRLPEDRQYRGNRYADKSLRLERDKKIAIVEYAPGAEVVADKHIWKSVGVTIEQELNSFDYRICHTCRDLQRSERGGLPIAGACRVCSDTSPGTTYRYIDPDGFTTDLTAGLREAGLHVDYGANRARSFLLAEGQGTEQTIEAHGLPQIHFAYRREGQLVALNSGADPDGFWLCERCGVHAPPPRTRRGRGLQNQSGHTTPWGETRCLGTSSQYHLGHAFSSDTLHLRFESTTNLVVPSGRNLAFWRSLTYALLEGSSIALQIERRDLDGVVRPFPIAITQNPTDNFSQEIVLFDNVPGGAGHVRRIADNLESVLRNALTVAQCAECEEETSCANCLRNYDNQIYWEEMRRGPVARFLEAIVAETFPEQLENEVAGAAHVGAVDKPRWLAQQISDAEQEVLIAVSRITRERPRGEMRTWVEILQELLRRSLRVSLALSEIPQADRNNLDAMGLRNHLYLLVEQYGLTLAVIDGQEFPSWHVVIDPEGERSRAIRLNGISPVLDQRSGEGGMLTTFHPDSVRTIATLAKSISVRAISALDLAPPAGVRVHHIQEGELVNESELYGDLFDSVLSTVEINDRYLRSDHHEARLRSYLTRILAHPHGRTRVNISTLAAEIQPGRHPAYRNSREQHDMFSRLRHDFPNLDIHYRIERVLSALPHDRFINLTQADGNRSRIGIGVGLDFINPNRRARATDVLIEDPF